MAATSIVIATPAYGEIFYKPYVESVLRLQREIDRRRWNSRFMTMSYAELSESRNSLLTKWFDKTDASHILFLDADMGFDPKLIFDMVDFDKPVVGVVYSQRKINLRRVASLSAQGESEARAIARGHKFIIKAARTTREMKGFIEVDACGTGILLVKRTCIEAMLRKIPDLSDADAPKYTPIAAGLDRLIRAFDITQAGGRRLSEDYSFCHRWRTMCDGEIWANITYEITHIGLHHFKGRYADVMRSRASDSQKKVVTGKFSVPGKRRPAK